MSYISGQPSIVPPDKIFSAEHANQITIAPTEVSPIKGNLYSFYCYNPNAAQFFLFFFNKSSTPTMGTDQPQDVFPIRAAEFLGLDLGGGPIGYYDKGLWVAVANSLDGTGAPAAAPLVKVSYHKG